LIQGEEAENQEFSKLRPGRREGCGEGVFKIWFYFSLSYSDLLGDTLNFFPKFSLFCCDADW